jgi:hypothetical protein
MTKRASIQDTTIKALMTPQLERSRAPQIRLRHAKLAGFGLL